jgi:hypothetical protein
MTEKLVFDCIFMFFTGLVFGMFGTVTVLKMLRDVEKNGR